MTTITKDSLELLLGHTAQHREAMLTPADGARMIWLYNDKERKYEAAGQSPLKRTRTVSNIASLAAMVLEEAARAPGDPLQTVPRQNVGEWMTVIFNTAGAHFHIDDRAGLVVFEYRRTLSPQWSALTKLAGQQLDHVGFYRALQALRPSIKSAADVLLAYRRIAVESGVTINSAPMIQDGKSGSSYELKLQVGSKATEASLPDKITFEIQYARGDTRTYELEAEINIEAKTVGANEAAKTVPMFQLVVPDRALVEERAVADELASFREQVKSLKRLHILENY